MAKSYTTVQWDWSSPEIKRRAEELRVEADRESRENLLTWLEVVALRKKIAREQDQRMREIESRKRS